MSHYPVTNDGKLATIRRRHLFALPVDKRAVLRRQRPRECSAGAGVNEYLLGRASSEALRTRVRHATTTHDWPMLSLPDRDDIGHL